MDKMYMLRYENLIIKYENMFARKDTYPDILKKYKKFNENKTGIVYNRLPKSKQNKETTNLNQRTSS